MPLRSQKIFSFSIVSLFFSLFLVNLINGMTSIKNIPHIAQFPKVMLAIIFLMGFFFLAKNLTKKILIFTTTCILVTAIGFFFSENLTFFKSTISTFYTTCFPITVFSLALRRYDFLYSYFSKASYLVSAIIFITYLTGLLSFDDTLYSMGFSYASIFFFLSLLDNYFKNRKISSLIFSLPIIFVIVMYGSRGALICIAAYFAIVLYRSFFFQKKKVQAALVVSVFALLFLFRNNLLQYFISVANKLGIYSRTLMSLSSGTFSESLGRQQIYSQIWNDFLKDPVAIRGINADYALTGIYSHNFILELLYEFGFIFGAILVILLLISILKTLHRENDMYKTNMLLLTLSIWLPYLLISSTIWVTPYFWVFLGLFLNRSKDSSIEESSIEESFFIPTLDT